LRTDSFNVTTKQLEQVFEFQNNNYYKMDWSDLQLNVQLCTFENPTFWWEASCDTTNPIASYEYPGSFETGAMGSKDLVLDFDTSEATPTQIAKILSLCTQFNPDSVIALRTVGTVQASISNGHSFGEEAFSQLALIGCS